jgi:crotonobetainyl-CoA:carnitine CoA-transferase CaiB-like acyl-CoA transferase
MSAILEGIKVLDLTRVIAGPMCTQILADMGATVYKIEKPGEGDDTRRMGPFLQDPATGQPSNDSALYLAYNRGKHSVTMDIATPEGAQLVRDLALRCDVVVENYKVGSLAKYGLDEDSLRSLKPELIYCSVTGFGQTGPYAPKPAYDFILQGMAGPMSTCGLPDDQPGGGPMRTAIPMTDMVTGLYATIGILGALMHRQKTGQGQAIDAAMLDATVAFNGHLAVGYLMSGKAPQRVGNTNPIASPSEVFDCADGLIIIAAGNNGQFQQLCAVLGEPDMPADPRFATNMQRIAYRSELRGALQALVRNRSRAQLLQQLSDATVPAGPINDMAQVFADPQTQHRQMVVELPHSSGQTVRVVRSPLNFSASPVTHRAPPRLGEHSLQALREELGLSEAQLAGLVARGVV